VSEHGLLQQRFRRNLYRYVNGESLSRQDALVSCIAPSVPFRRQAAKISRQYGKAYSGQFDKGLSKQIPIDAYEGKNSHVLQMMELLSDLPNDLVGAYLHGSLGTYEEIAFSDFDALVIIRDDVLRSPERLSRVAYRIYSAQSIMFDFDPLQHHGWVVLSEADLQDYPEDRFPSELFRHAKSLFVHQGRGLNICTGDSSRNARQGFDNLCRSAAKRIGRRKSMRNMYELKILLSQFMLLPSLYIEMRDGGGVYKKYSFEAARADFSPQDWSIMDDVSSIREQWSYHIPPLARRLMTRPTRLSRYLVKNYSPALPETIRKTLTDDFLHRMTRLISLMSAKAR